MSMDSDQILQLLTSLVHDQQNQDKKLGKLKNQMGEIMEFVAQIQGQSELSNSTIENFKEDFEIHDAIILESGMEVGTSPKTSKSSQEEDEQLLIEDEEEDTPTARVEQPLPQPPRVPMSSNSGKVVPNSINSNPIPPNVPFPRRFLIPKQEESEKDIVEALPKVQNDIPILGATKQVLDCVELFKGLCTPRRMIQEKEGAREYQEFIKEDVFETTKPKDIEFYDRGQVPTITFNLAESNIPETFQEVVFVIEFLSDKAKLKPLADHFKYHLPFKDQFHAMGPRGA
ncbi:hypothetical protein ACFX14_006960 [Malus domestica]